MRQTLLKRDDHRIFLLLNMGPFERRKNGWRFGTKRIADQVVDRFIAAGVAVQEGNIVRMLQANGPLDSGALEPAPDAIAPYAVTLPMISAPTTGEATIDAPLVLLDQAPVIPA